MFVSLFILLFDLLYLLTKYYCISNQFWLNLKIFDFLNSNQKKGQKFLDYFTIYRQTVN